MYEFGPAVFSFIEKALNPKEHPITKKVAPVMNAFDMWQGANFNLLINKTEHGWNYDESGFDSPEPIDKSDAVLEAIFAKTYSLKEFTDAKNYKTVEALQKRLVEVLGLTYRGLEVVEGYGQGMPQSHQQASAPPVGGESVAKEATSVAPMETTFGNSSDEDLFNELMNEDVPF